MKVSFISTPDDGSCGIGTYTGTLIRALPNSVESKNYEIPLGSIKPFVYLKQAIRAPGYDVDIVHVQHEYGIYGPKSLWSWILFPVLFVFSRLTRTSIIFTMHSAWNGEKISSGQSGLKGLYVYALNKLLSFTSDQMIFLSENCKNDFEKSVNTNSKILEHGVQNPENILSKEEAKEQFGYDETDTVITEPGYVRPEKGTDRILNIAEQIPEYEFLIAGGDNDGSGLAAKISENNLDNVQITGVLDDNNFHASFHASDVIFLPYREVTQSGIFNWCSTYRVPVVGSDVDYFRNIKQEYGCIRIINLGNVEEVVKNLKKVVESEEIKERLVSSMRDYEKNNSIDEVAKEHVEIYNNHD